VVAVYTVYFNSGVFEDTLKQVPTGSVIVVKKVQVIACEINSAHAFGEKEANHRSFDTVESEHGLVFYGFSQRRVRLGLERNTSRYDEVKATVHFYSEDQIVARQR
jgi:hypothetical protein